MNDQASVKILSLLRSTWILLFRTSSPPNLSHSRMTTISKIYMIRLPSQLKKDLLFALYTFQMSILTLSISQVPFQIAKIICAAAWLLVSPNIKMISLLVSGELKTATSLFRPSKLCLITSWRQTYQTWFSGLEITPPITYGATMKTSQLRTRSKSLK